MEKNALQTKHVLDFEACPWPRNDGWNMFRIGTCEGLWRARSGAYQILAILNTKPGNGHFEDVLEWFEFACRRDHRNLSFLEVDNQKFKVHLVLKRGFTPVMNTDHVTKIYQHFNDRSVRAILAKQLVKEAQHG